MLTARPTSLNRSQVPNVLNLKSSLFLSLASSTLCERLAVLEVAAW